MPPSKRSSSHHQNQTNHVAHHPQTQTQKAAAAAGAGAGDDTDSIPQNSITVASRTMPVRARSVSSSSSSGSPLSSSHSSPAKPQLIAAKPVQVASTELVRSTNSTSPKQHHPTPASPVATIHTNGTDNTANMVANTTAPRQQKLQPVTSYEMSSNLEEITMRQLEEDISAYQHDEAFCLAQLEDPDLTPQETRTLQLRVLDLGHQVRHCRHRIETIQFQLRKARPALGLRPAYGGMGAPLIPASAASAAANGNSADGNRVKVHVNVKHPSSSGSSGGVIVKRNGANAATPGGNNKRSAESEEAADGHLSETNKKVKVGSSPAPVGDYSEMQVDGGGEGARVDLRGINTALQRLGFWKCQLCSAPKYLLAGSGRSPAAPCKWPLKDISKMITHFTEMHGEHSPNERCVELGAALAKNRGPFEYWLRRTRAQNIGDGSMIDDCISSLLQGEMPNLLRRHSRAAAGMPSE
ncbi:hypothetical protein QBC44DRAFT_353771 [Cladorrhinum sp. PSN332]|nr:hypothetical protein QBC44DRAFT_353771 [Cladorrhinum sp. PSN332]